MSVEIQEKLRQLSESIEGIAQEVARLSNPEPEHENPFPAAQVALLTTEFSKLERFFQTKVYDHQIEFSFKPPAEQYFRRITDVECASAAFSVLSMASFFVKIHEADLKKLKARDEMILSQKKEMEELQEIVNKVNDIRCSEWPKASNKILISLQEALGIEEDSKGKKNEKE